MKLLLSFEEQDQLIKKGIIDSKISLEVGPNFTESSIDAVALLQAALEGITFLSRNSFSSYTQPVQDLFIKQKTFQQKKFQLQIHITEDPSEWIEYPDDIEEESLEKDIINEQL